MSAAAAGIVLGAAATTIAVSRPPRAASANVVRSIVTAFPAERLQALPADATTNEGRPSRTAFVWTPDGQAVVFSGSAGGHRQLFFRALNQLEATPIPGTADASNPFLSPDGKWIGFVAGRTIQKVPVAGGPSTTICQLPADSNDEFEFGASWGDDGFIVYSRARQGLWRISAAGGTPQQLTIPERAKGELKHLAPQVLPGSRAVVFTVTHTPLPTWDDTEVVVQEIATGTRRARLESAADGRYVASGHLLCLRRGTLMAVPFDLATLAVTGGAISVVSGVMQAANMANESYDSGAGQFAVSSAGALLYVPGGIFPEPERSLVWVSRSGVAEPLALPVRAYMAPRISPDGKSFTVWTQGDRRIWIYDLARRVLSNVNIEGRNTRGIWSPDGSRLALTGTVSSVEENGFLVAADGSGTPERLTTCDCATYAAAWTPDGRTIVVVESKESRDIVLVEADGAHKVTPLLGGKADEQYPDLSPDGRWIAYTSNESGRSEVYVQSFPRLGARHQVSIDGGTAPAWSRDGKELFYTTTTTVGGQPDATKMMAVSATTGADFTAGLPHALFEGRYGATAIIRSYDVGRDGRFLMVTQKERAPITVSQMVLVQNWFDELRQKAPPGAK